MDRQTRPGQAALALNVRSKIRWKGDLFKGEGQTELVRFQTECRGGAEQVDSGKILRLNMVGWVEIPGGLNYEAGSRF